MATSSVMRRLTIDPGVHHFAMASWENNDLRCVEYVDREPLGKGGWVLSRYVSSFTPHEILIEQPKVYDARFQKGDQKDIRDLAVAVGALFVYASIPNGTLALGEPMLIEPHRWKGTVDKKIMLLRIYGKLTPAEVGIAHASVSAKKIMAGVHSGRGAGADVLDAIGIGLWRVGRLGQGRSR